ncbi:DNA primase, partial [Vibrio vulnificus]|nr:DNA primase [Vibrio vulnificus]
EAMEAGWRPKKKDYSEEDKKKLFAEYEQRKKAAELRRAKVEIDQWKALEQEEKLFKRWPSTFAPTQYMIKKQMADISRFVDVRLGRDKYNNSCLVWPIYEDLFNQGRFCGFERILDKSFQIGDRTINKLSSDNARTDLGF